MQTNNISFLSRSRLQALLCVGLFCMAYFASWPFSGLPDGDDFSYIKSALDYAHTGHLHYNGWATAMLGWLVPWGALAIKLFGFSFNVLRLSVLPIAAACTYLFHRILRRFGLGDQLAVFGTLVFVLSPLFLPLATTFMTDVPGLFVLLLSLWACQHALIAESDASAAMWLIFAALASAFGGSTRQIVWMATIAMVPSTLWLLRGRRRVLLPGLLAWCLGIAVVVSFSVWFKHQPYSIPERLLPPQWHLKLLPHGTAQMTRMALCTLLLALPILVGWSGSWRKLDRKPRIVFGSVTLTFFVLVALVTRGPKNSDWLLPWLVPTLSALQMDLRVGPAVWLRLLVTLALLGCLFSFGVTVVRSSSAREPSKQLREAFWLLVPFTLGCLALMLPRATTAFVQDRYALVLLPCVIVFLLLIHQRTIGNSPSHLSLAVLGIAAYWGIAGNHDVFRGYRTQQAILEQLEAQGIARENISSGLGFDGWTQVMGGDYINNFHLENPSDAYHPDPALPHRDLGCDDWFSIYTPRIHSRYLVAPEPRDCPGSTVVGDVTYTRWLPPFHDHILTQQLPLP